MYGHVLCVEQTPMNKTNHIDGSLKSCIQLCQHYAQTIIVDSMQSSYNYMLQINRWLEILICHLQPNIDIECEGLSSAAHYVDLLICCVSNCKG